MNPTGSPSSQVSTLGARSAFFGGPAKVLEDDIPALRGSDDGRGRFLSDDLDYAVPFPSGHATDNTTLALEVGGECVLHRLALAPHMCLDSGRGAQIDFGSDTGIICGKDGRSVQVKVDPHGFRGDKAIGFRNLKRKNERPWKEGHLPKPMLRPLLPVLVLHRIVQRESEPDPGPDGENQVVVTNAAETLICPGNQAVGSRSPRVAPRSFQSPVGTGNPDRHRTGGVMPVGSVAGPPGVGEPSRGLLSKGDCRSMVFIEGDPEEVANHRADVVEET
ncbi:MAG TPA: hypothetical protein VJ021_06320 [Thermoplasmata archaeon]|nr:hypothetical protein [Thermoplasmata archaeon]